MEYSERKIARVFVRVGQTVGERGHITSNMKSDIKRMRE